MKNFDALSPARMKATKSSVPVSMAATIARACAPAI
jgi:hypothetical protein